jgi:hypothetical protein
MLNLVGFTANFIPASSGVRSALNALHLLHAATRLSHLEEPPLDFGMM